MNDEIRRSPLFYVGDKYRLMGQLLSLFPNRVNNFYEPFVGGGTVFLNIEANKYFLNEINEKLVGIHKFLISHANKRKEFFRKVDSIIGIYNLSHSYKDNIVPDSLKNRYKKTYYAKFNHAGYNELRKKVNEEKIKDPLRLYILLIYGFNRMLRFNSAGRFNLPVGNVDFNRNVEEALTSYFENVIDKEITFTATDFRVFLSRLKFKKNDFVYFDPPYLIAASEYNKTWKHSDEDALFLLIDKLNLKGIKFALSNITHYKNSKNQKLIEWMSDYRVHNIQSNYINYHNNHSKNIREVLITNY